MNKDSFLSSLRKDLERELEQLKIEKEREKEKNQLKLVEFRKNVSEEVMQNYEKNRSELTEMLEKAGASLKNYLENLMNENKKESIVWREKEVEIIRKELAETERKNAEKIKELESKLRKLYYWLFGTFFVLSVIIIGGFFYFRSSLGK